MSAELCLAGARVGDLYKACKVGKAKGIVPSRNGKMGGIPQSRPNIKTRDLQVMLS